MSITDDWSAYSKLKTFDFKHHPFAENGNPEVAEEHLPLIHLVFSNLKAWLIGVHHGVAPQHLAGAHVRIRVEVIVP